ncbi:MAG: chloride channel protein [Acidimicrobiales bacterium]|nr:chloride channel protein [Acidimicrobiales bacterium]
MSIAPPAATPLPPATVRWWARLLALAAAVGVLAGLASAGFLATLEWATETRVAHPALLWGLPFAGFAIGLAYHHRGKGSAAGNNLILDEIGETRSWIPRRMAPLVYGGTIATHLFGGSAGREGTAIQMAGSLADGLNRRFGVEGTDRRLVLLAAIAGGFGSVFGVPAAGFVFALEVQPVAGLRLRALPLTVVASVVGNAAVHLTGVDHTPLPHVDAVDWSAPLVAKVALAAVAFGLTSVAFAEGIHRTKALLARAVSWPPLRPLLGGFAIIALTYLVGTRDYLGLSLPLIGESMAGGAGIVAGAFALKLLFTVVTLGSGFQGGEVTPLFVIGTTLGVTLANALDVPVPLLAALGFVAVFAGATNTPIACTVMGIELFGPEAALLFALACTVSYVASGPGGIYTSQQRRRRTWGFHHLRPGDPAASL